MTTSLILTRIIPNTNEQTANSKRLTPDMNLHEAGNIWIEMQRGRVRTRTLETDENYLSNLLKHFGEIPLQGFRIDHFEHYQRTRIKTAGPSMINHELNVLSRILRLVNLWAPIKSRYKQLPPAAWKAPKIFDAPEQEKIFKKLKNTPELDLAEIVFTITRNTTAAGCELRGLRLRDVELEADPPRIHIPVDSTKNNIRPRLIPLNEDALEAFKRALARASRLGCKYPEHYVFPFRVNRALWDPTKPASRSWLRKQVKELRELTGIEHITPHVFRHLAVTEMLERGAPEQTVIAVAGWVGRKMIETYSHARIEAKADAVNLLTAKAGVQPAEPEQPPAQAPAPDFIMQPEVQAEIARQVTLVLRGLLGGVTK